MKDIFQFLLGLAMLVLIAYGIFYFFDLQPGNINDWLVGILSFLWLLTITTVPWNAHFKAKEVLDDAEISKRKDILVIDSSLAYVKKIANRSLFLAIFLHLASAGVLYYIASMGVSKIGYYAAALAIALTFLRPTVRFYEYLRRRLENIKQEFRYPREDLQSLLQRTHKLEQVLDNRKEVASWRNEVTQTFENIQRQLEELNKQQGNVSEELKGAITKLSANIEEVSQNHHLQLEKITTDSKVLDAVRELAGFFKKI